MKEILNAIMCTLNGILAIVLLILGVYLGIVANKYDEANFCLLLSISSYLSFNFDRDRIEKDLNKNNE